MPKFKDRRATSQNKKSEQDAHGHAAERLRIQHPAALRGLLTPAGGSGLQQHNCQQLRQLELIEKLPLKSYEELAACISQGSHQGSSSSKRSGGLPALEVLSLAGSHCGDAPVLALLPALPHHPKLSALDLSCCGLSDAAGVRVASLIRAHAATAAQEVWARTLRTACSSSRGSGSSIKTHRALLSQHQKSEQGWCDLQQLAAQGSHPAGLHAAVCAGGARQGLQVLDLSKNLLTATTLAALAGALADEHCCLRLLSLSFNPQLPPAPAAAAVLRSALTADAPAHQVMVELLQAPAPAAAAVAILSSVGSPATNASPASRSRHKHNGSTSSGSGGSSSGTKILGRSSSSGAGSRRAANAAVLAPTHPEVQLFSGVFVYEPSGTARQGAGSVQQQQQQQQQVAGNAEQQQQQHHHHHHRKHHHHRQQQQQLRLPELLQDSPHTLQQQQQEETLGHQQQQQGPCLQQGGEQRTGETMQQQHSGEAMQPKQQQQQQQRHTLKAWRAAHAVAAIHASPTADAASNSQQHTAQTRHLQEQQQQQEEEEEEHKQLQEAQVQHRVLPQQGQPLGQIAADLNQQLLLYQQWHQQQRHHEQQQQQRQHRRKAAAKHASRSPDKRDQGSPSPAAVKQRSKSAQPAVHEPVSTTVSSAAGTDCCHKSGAAVQQLLCAGVPSHLCPARIAPQGAAAAAAAAAVASEAAASAAAAGQECDAGGVAVESTTSGFPNELVQLAQAMCVLTDAVSQLEALVLTGG